MKCLWFVPIGITGSLVFGCGMSATTGNALNCGVAKSSPDKGKSQASQLVDLNSESEARLGVGYLDITSTGAQGEQTIRCTATIQPAEGKNDHIHVITAQHCGWDADTEEFSSSKYKLQVWYNGGYFPVPGEMIGQAQWGIFARAMKPYLHFLSDRFQTNFANSTSSAAMQSCLDLTGEINLKKPLAKDVLCFSAKEKRRLLMKVKVDKKQEGRLKRVLQAVGNRQTAALDNLPEPERTIFNFFTNQPSSFERLSAHLTTIGFLLNTRFCSTSESDGPFDTDGHAIKREACAFKPLLLSFIQKELPQHYREVMAITERNFSSNAEMQEFYDSQLRCSLKNLDDIKLGQFKVPRNSCDLDMFSGHVWMKWGRHGPQHLQSIQIKDPSRDGFNDQSFYALRTNSLGGREAALSGDVSKSTSRIHRINNQLGEILPKFSAFAFLFDPKDTNIWITKKDSGSQLSIFGVFPAAVISTYNDEPTSGGASILALPEPEEEKTDSASGC